MSDTKYHPEPYWSTVAKRIKAREEKNVIAGDDEPYYRYKRERFLGMLHSVPFAGKTVLELGCGPGGNLLEVLKHQPTKLTAVDISQDMVDLANKNIGGQVEIIKINGTTLPFPDQAFDVAFTATVLQHNTDEEMMKKILREVCRVTRGQVVLFERVENSIKGDDLCKGRPVDYFAAICDEQGFDLKKVDFINIETSYLVCGAIRKGLNPGDREEGEPLNGVSIFLQNATLPLTKLLDKIFTARRDLGMMVFERRS